MKFKDLFLFLEQVPEEPHLDDEGNLIDADGNIIEPALDDDEDPDDGDNFPVDVENPPLPADPDRPAKPKKLSQTQQVKQKWREETPGITEFEMDDAIAFFRQRKDALRPYHPYGYIDPETNNHYINTPEVFSLVERFPFMDEPLSRKDTMGDLRNYPWEVMDYYMDSVRAANVVVDEENLVPGTKLPLEEQLELAKEKWTVPANRIINDGGLIIYKIESKNESIALGSIQRLLNLKRRDEGNFHGSAYWCTTVPLNDRSRGNLWTNYRPANGFYYVWDQNRNETDKYYCCAIQAKQYGDFGLVDLYNNTTSDHNWEYIVRIYPQLEGKQQFFPWFGTTAKERQDLTIDKISMEPGHKYYFGTIPKTYQEAYVDSGRHINQVRAFLTMDPKLRKHYIDKTALENNDLQTRFVCSDPNDPFGILEVLRLEIKPENLYKYLDFKILKTNFKISEGVIAIKKLIIGTTWRRWVSDEKTNHTLITTQTKQIDRNTKFGIMKIDDAEIVKDINYVLTLTRSYLYKYEDENGITRRKRYISQKYNYALGNGNVDPEQYFYAFTTPEALTVKNSPDYMKAKIFEGPDGDEFIQTKINDKVLTRI